MKAIENVSRRGFLKGVVSAAGLVLAVRYLPQSALAAGLPHDSHADLATFDPSMFVGIDTDGTTWIIASRSEMGTLIRTSLPLVVADELNADWKRVRIQQAIGDPRYGSQDTDGSHSVRSLFEVVRRAGATARTMLVQAAAERWGVPVSECESELHVVVHRGTNRRLGYGELAAAAAKLPVPKLEELKFKPKSAWRYIGKGWPSYDLENICTGKAVYGIDARLDNMVYASIEHPPVLGGKAKSYDEKDVLKVPGVRQTVPLAPFTPPPGFQPLGGIAVIADNTWAAFEGRKKLDVVWDNGPNASYNSDEYQKTLRATAHKPCLVVRNEGDVDTVFAKGSRIVEADYSVPLLAHAAMEPLSAVVDYKDGKVTAWAPTQNPQAVQTTVAQQLGIPKDDVVCHVTLLGGGFGRKSMPDSVAEAAVLSKKIGRPVKVVWKREDDMKFDYFNAVAAMYMKAALDPSGRAIAWLQRSVFPPIASLFDVNGVYGGPGVMGHGWVDIPYDLPNLRCENGPAHAHVRIGWMRSVANIYQAFAIQCFSDELAHIARRDPVDHLLDLIGKPRIVDLKDTKYHNYGASFKTYPVDTGRLRRVIEIAAEKSGWGKRKFAKGSGIGIAAHRCFCTYVATVVEVEVDDQGTVRIPRVDTVVDAGLVVNPAAVRAQFQGAAVFGTSIVRSGRITATNGAIDQSNFQDYPVARINQAPYHTNVYIVDTDKPPAGVGEPGVPPYIAAMCNAIFAATGKRIRSLPMSNYNLI